MEEELQQLRRRLQEEARGFFNADAPVFVGRAPGRLDVMGGIADYSGSLVLESPISAAALVAVQRRHDRKLRAWTVGPEAASVARPLVEFSLDDFQAGEGGGLKPAGAIRQMFVAADARWSGYVLGIFYILQACGEMTRIDCGADMLIWSTVPMGAGVSSSAALEVAAMAAVEGAYGFTLPDLRLARLCQLVEHQMVGAPCGIMDQVTVGLGHAGKLLALRCQPHDLVGRQQVPPGCHFVGIDCGVKHSVGGGRYVRARVGAFMGLKIITQHLGHDPYGGYLCNITPAEFRQRYYSILPSHTRGADFLERYGPIDDTATSVEPETTYSPRACVEHAVYENDRVQRFARLLGLNGGTPQERYLREAGRLMYGSHWSYGSRCGLGARETDLLVQLARRHEAEGVLGAKITGGGSGGTVAFMLANGAVDGAAVQSIAQEYQEQTGIRPRIVDGTSPGAREWGVRRIDS